MGNGARRNNPRRCNIPIDDDEDDDDDDEGVRRRGEWRDRATIPDGDNATAVVAAAARVEQYVFVINGSIAPTGTTTTTTRTNLKQMGEGTADRPCEFVCTWYRTIFPCLHHAVARLPSAPIPSIIQRISRRQAFHYKQ